MIKKFTIRFCLILISASFYFNSFAQQDPQLSQFMFNRFVYNPAFAGSDNAISSTLMLRNQWIDFDGAPLTQTLSTHMPMETLKGGVGLHIINDKLGAERSTSVMAAYAYRHKLDFGVLSAGINLGFAQKSLDGARLRSNDGSYESGNIDHNDNKIPVSVVGSLAPDLGLGFALNAEKYYAGFSITHLIPAKFIYEDPSLTTKITYIQNYYLTGGYNHQINYDFTIRPSMLLKTDFRKTQIDVNGTLVYRNNLWGGLSYRGVTKDNSDAFIAILGMNLTDNLLFSYSYDITTSKIRSYSSGSHEFLLNYKFNLVMPTKPEKITYTPRFL